MSTRIRDGDVMSTTNAFFASEIRNYPVGTRVTVEQNTRDMYANGYMKPGVMVRVRIERDDTILFYRQNELTHVVAHRRSK